MRCRDAKEWLTAQHADDLSQPEGVFPPDLQEHLKQCPACYMEAEQYVERHQQVDTTLRAMPARISSRISTEQIMLAVQQQRRISEQLEDLRAKQQSRVARMRPIGTVLAAISFFILGSIPLLVLAIAIVRTDLMVQTLAVFNNVIGILIVLAQYLQTGLTLVTRNSWLLSGVAFVIVVMMGMWLRLMRPPQEV